MNNKDPFLTKLETLINKMKKIRSDLENCKAADVDPLVSAASSALENFLNDGEKEVGDTDYE